MALALVKPTLQELRQIIGANSYAAKEKSVCSLYPEGFPRGSLIEMSGIGKTKLVAQFLSENQDYKIAWLEKRISVNPYALKQKNVNVKNILFIEAQDEIQWCTTQVLQSGCFQVIVSNEPKVDEKSLRRYQLFAERSSLHFFLLTEELHQSWVPQLQLKVSQDYLGLQVQTVKKRGFA